MSSEKMASMRQLAKGKSMRATTTNFARTQSVDESRVAAPLQTQQTSPDTPTLENSQVPVPSSPSTDSAAAASSIDTIVPTSAVVSDLPPVPPSPNGTHHSRVAFSPLTESQQEKQPPVSTAATTDPIPLRKLSTQSNGTPPSDSGGSAEENDRSMSIAHASPSLLLQQDSRDIQPATPAIQPDSGTAATDVRTSDSSEQTKHEKEEAESEEESEPEPPDEVREFLNPLFKGNLKIFQDMGTSYYFEDIEMELTYFNKHKRLRRSSDRVQQLRREGQHQQVVVPNLSPAFSSTGSFSPPSNVQSFRTASEGSISLEDGENEAEMGDSTNGSPVLEASLSEQAIFSGGGGGGDGVGGDKEGDLLSPHDSNLANPDVKAESARDQKPRVVYATDNFPSHWTTSIALLKMQNTDIRNKNVYRNEDPWKTLTVSWRILRNM